MSDNTNLNFNGLHIMNTTTIENKLISRSQFTYKRSQLSLNAKMGRDCLVHRPGSLAIEKHLEAFLARRISLVNNTIMSYGSDIQVQVSRR